MAGWQTDAGAARSSDILSDFVPALPLVHTASRRNRKPPRTQGDDDPVAKRMPAVL